jgi:hypothetical protein
MLFHRCFSILYCTNTAQGFNFSTFLPTFVIFCSLTVAILGGELASHCGFDLQLVILIFCNNF